MPSSLEKSLAKPYGYYAELALKSPKISIDDPRVTEYMASVMINPYTREPQHTQFGNNFVLLFHSLDIQDPDNPLVEDYRRSGEHLGQVWQDFLGENRPLLKDIKQAVLGTRPYSELLGAFSNLLRDNHQDLAEKLNVFAAHPLGIEAVGLYSWDILNPLMETASQRMTIMGIDTRQFYR